MGYNVTSSLLDDLRGRAAAQGVSRQPPESQREVAAGCASVRECPWAGLEQTGGRVPTGWLLATPASRISLSGRALPAASPSSSARTATRTQSPDRRGFRNRRGADDRRGAASTPERRRASVGHDVTVPSLGRMSSTRTPSRRTPASGRLRTGRKMPRHSQSLNDVGQLWASRYLGGADLSGSQRSIRVSPAVPKSSYQSRIWPSRARADDGTRTHDTWLGKPIRRRRRSTTDGNER
jgi:hypothetical protein